MAIDAEAHNVLTADAQIRVKTTALRKVTNRTVRGARRATEDLDLPGDPLALAKNRAQ